MIMARLAISLLGKATCVAVVAFSLSAWAEEKQPQLADPNQTVTLTLGELQTLLQAERAQAQATAIAAKINAQIKPNTAAK
jgi:hypothetical protein